MTGEFAARGFVNKNGTVDNLTFDLVAESSESSGFRNIWDTEGDFYDSLKYFSNTLRKITNPSKVRPVLCNGQSWNRKKKRVSLSPFERQQKKIQRIKAMTQQMMSSTKIVAHAPRDSVSSISDGMTNGIYPIRNKFSDLDSVSIFDEEKKFLPVLGMVRGKHRKPDDSIIEYFIQDPFKAVGAFQETSMVKEAREESSVEDPIDFSITRLLDTE